jgi:hypothetical protein
MLAVPSFCCTSATDPAIDCIVEKQLSWAQSYKASLLDQHRTEITDAELVGLDWRIQFHNSFRPSDACFYADQHYTDSVFFEVTSPTRWGIDGSNLEIENTPSKHQLGRTSGWVWRLSNRMVDVWSTHIRDTPCGALVVGTAGAAEDQVAAEGQGLGYSVR